MRTLRLLIEYDGNHFVGWQSQNRGRTVQNELERALHVLTKESIRPVGSGRTDAGTHALGQVAHFQTASNLSTERLLRGLNGLLPADIAIRTIDEAPTDFHARYSAVCKCYRYRIHLTKSALNRSQVWAYYQTLSLAPMRDAAHALVGTHGFGAFCKQDPVPDSLDCHIYAADWNAQGAELIFEIVANRFLRHMVRILVGTMVEIGRGARPAEDIATLLASGERAKAGPTAPARGLCLIRVAYDT